MEHIEINTKSTAPEPEVQVRVKCSHCNGIGSVQVYDDVEGLVARECMKCEGGYNYEWKDLISVISEQLTMNLIERSELRKKIIAEYPPTSHNIELIPES